MSNVISLDSYRKEKEKRSESVQPENNRVVNLKSYQDSRYKNKTNQVFDYCLHECCPRCHGSGIREDNHQPCFHHIVCRCQKCIGFN